MKSQMPCLALPHRKQLKNIQSSHDGMMSKTSDFKPLDFLRSYIEHSRRSPERQHTDMSYRKRRPNMVPSRLGIKMKKQPQMPNGCLSRAGRRCQVSNNVFHHFYELIERRSLDYNLHCLAHYYDELEDMGFTQKKIVQLARSSLLDKPSLLQVIMNFGQNDILTGKIKYEIRRDPQVILNRWKQIAFQKDVNSFEHFLHQILLYKEKIEEAVLESRSRKIDEVQRSIKRQKSDSQRQRLRQMLFPVGIRSHRVNYDRMEKVGQAFCSLQRKFGVFNKISDHNRKVYGMLLGAERRLDESSSQLLCRRGSNKENCLDMKKRTAGRLMKPQ